MKKIIALIILALLICWTGALQAQQIDVNSASGSELQRIKGIGAKKAQAIIDERESGGAFTSLADLAGRVKGIGPKTVEKWRAAGNVAVLDPGGSDQVPVTESPSEAADTGVTLNRAELVNEISAILTEHGYTNIRTNNSVAARIADYLKEKGGLILE